MIKALLFAIVVVFIFFLKPFAALVERIVPGQEDALPLWPAALGHAHNYYLNLLAEGGLPLLSAYLLWLAAAVWAVWQRARRSTGLAQVVALSALGMLGHLIIHSMVDNLYVHEMYLLIAMVLGLATAPRDPETIPFGPER